MKHVLKHRSRHRATSWQQIEEALGRTLTDAERDRWRQYMDLFERWKERTNLVSTADRRRWVEQHVVPSLELGRFLGLPVEGSVLDLGTGAGFPGIPLALAYPGVDFVLVDSKRRRVLFLQEVVESLRLDNVGVVCSRVEDGDFQMRWRGAFQLVLARAVADLRTLWEWSRGLLGEEGQLVSLKGPGVLEEEIADLRERYGGEVVVETSLANGRRRSFLVRVRRRD